MSIHRTVGRLENVHEKAPGKCTLRSQKSDGCKEFNEAKIRFKDEKS